MYTIYGNISYDNFFRQWYVLYIAQADIDISLSIRLLAINRSACPVAINFFHLNECINLCYRKKRLAQVMTLIICTCSNCNTFLRLKQKTAMS